MTYQRAAKKMLWFPWKKHNIEQLPSWYEVSLKNYLSAYEFSNILIYKSSLGDLRVYKT